MLSKPLLHRLLKQIPPDETPFVVRYWDGSAERYGRVGGDGMGDPEPPIFTLTIRDPKAFALMQGNTILQFGEAYMRDQIDVEGDMSEMIALGVRSGSLLEQTLPLWLREALTGAPPLSRRSPKRQKEDIAAHYDLGNEFFRLWLDRSLTYSCAYFRTGGETLEEAQARKIDYSLRKLRLIPGEKLLDVGCGWGALVMHAAERYRVQALGITLSEEQRRSACEAIAARSLTKNADVRLMHYAALSQLAHKHQAQPFDKIVSIGMMEHIGKAHLPEFAEAVDTLLRPGGLALLHLITSVNEGPLNPWSAKYIFPGAYIPTTPEVLGLLNARRFHLWDVENLGPHYCRTLDAWAERFENAVPQVRAMYGEEFVRMWRLYLRGTSACFREGTLEVHQFLVSKEGARPLLPLTREDLIASH